MDRVLITVGLNELPVLVAAYRLCRICWDAGKPLPGLSVLASEDSIKEAGRVKEALAQKLRTEDMITDPAQLDWSVVKVKDAFHPAEIQRALRAEIDAKPAQSWHLDYTGGTSAMGAHAMEILLEKRGPGPNFRYDLDVSYVSAKDHRLFGGDKSILQGEVDERRSWNLSVKQLAELHGFATKPSPEPDSSLLDLGQKMTDLLASDYETGLGPYNRWLDQKHWDWKIPDRFGRARPWKKWPELPPREHWPSAPIPWPANVTHPGWAKLTEEIRNRFGPSAWSQDPHGSWQINARQLADADLLGLRRFVAHQCLELVALRALRSALEELGGPVHWAYSVECWRGDKENKFELDVAAVCGYELLAVSCYLGNIQQVVKNKAFEVMHRARAIGGSSARGIVLSLLKPDLCHFVDQNLKDDLGGRDKSVHVWSYSSEAPLQKDFETYFTREMKWRAQS
jgi:hypothetical protein